MTDLKNIFVSTTFAEDDSKISDILKACKRGNISNLELIIVDDHSTDGTTEIIKKLNQDKNFLSNINKLIPLGRMANKEDFRGGIVYLASDMSKYVSGHILSIDGGWGIW